MTPPALVLRDWRPLMQPGRGRHLPLVLLTGLGNTAAVYDDLAPHLAGDELTGSRGATPSGWRGWCCRPQMAGGWGAPMAPWPG